MTGGAVYVGGLAGGNYGYITDSRAAGNVSGSRCTGGFVGGNNGSIINCSAAGDVAGADDTGGFAGSTMEVVRHSFSTGNVKSSGNNSGGFAGSASGEVKECACAGKLTPGASDMTYGGFAGSYKGKLAGLEKDIQFKDNRGYCVLAGGEETGAIGNMSSSAIESEQKVLNDTKTTDWKTLADFFKSMYGVSLNASGTVTRDEEEGPEKTAGKLVDKLAASGKASDQMAWMICDIAMYDRFVGRKLSLTEETRQAYMDYLDGVFSAKSDPVPDVSSAELAKAVISVKAMGMDPAKFKTGGKTYDIPAMLKKKAGGDRFMKQGIYTEPYILIALSQDKSYASKEELKAMTAALLAQQRPEGGWGGIDADSPVILALKMQPQTKEIQKAVNKAMSKSRISGMMDSTGAVSYSGKASSESTAQLIIALCSAGIDPDKYVKSGKTITDGLMSFYEADEGIFYHDREKSGSPEISTEQALRALIAEMKLRKDKGLIYCFGQEKYSNSAVEPDEPAPDDPTIDDTKADDPKPDDPKPDVPESDGPEPVTIRISLSQKAGKAAKISWTSKNMKTVLERRTGSKGKWKKLKESSADKASFTDKNMKNGVIYYYRVLPQDKSYRKEYGSVVKKAMRLKKVSVKSAKWRKGKLTVRYKIPKVYGSAAKKTGGKVRVEVIVSRTKKLRKGKYKTYKVTSKKAFTKKLKKAQAKYIRVRVTVKAGGKTFRSPTAVRKVK